MILGRQPRCPPKKTSPVGKKSRLKSSRRGPVPGVEADRRGGKHAEAAPGRGAGTAVLARRFACQEPMWSREAIRCGIYRDATIDAVIDIGEFIGPTGVRSAIHTGSTPARSSGCPGRGGSGRQAICIACRQSHTAPRTRRAGGTCVGNGQGDVP